MIGDVQDTPEDSRHSINLQSTELKANEDPPKTTLPVQIKRKKV